MYGRGWEGLEWRRRSSKMGWCRMAKLGSLLFIQFRFRWFFFFIFYSDFQFFDMDLLYLVLDDILLIRGSFLCLRVYKVCISCRDCLLCREGLFDWLLKALFLGASFWIIYYNCHFFFNFFWLVLFISAGFKLATTSSLFPKLCNCRTMPKHYWNGKVTP